MPKDNEVDEKVMPVAWIVTNGGESCEPWLEYEESEVDALPAVCIAEPLYSAATVAELRAKADAAERRVGELEVALRNLRDAFVFRQAIVASADTIEKIDFADSKAWKACDEAKAALTGADQT